ncbi:MAG: serine/threonine protein kinase [Singulisphaera sp.]|nr:serine/threonine protein kinase [Singulisphaera sp.]
MATDTNTAGGETIGGFRYLRTIHPGATSVIMEVVQESTGKRFALKQLLASRAEDPNERRLFQSEAKIGMLLRHPNLIHVHECFLRSEQPYFIMDLFTGYHLKLPIARPSVYPMPGGRLHRIITRAARALAYMHEKHWIHRDIKPENILVNKAGEVRLIDLALALRYRTGLAKLFGGKPKRQGTPSYMSPEQIRCRPPTPAADIYSFGITCYELACGRPPFRGDSKAQLLNKHMNDRPAPLTAHNASVTPEFNDLVLQMIQKQPEARPASMSDFLIRFARIRICKDDPDPMAER